MEMTRAVAQHLAATSFADLPPEAVAATRGFTMDSIGTALAGSSAPGAREVVEVTRRWGGREEATLIAFGGKLPAPLAALVNGTLIHARDFDDTHDLAGVHAFASVRPAALAVAEAQGGVSGREFVTALALGADLVSRLGLSLRLYKGWHFSGICGGFGAAAAAGKLLGLDEAGMVNALGIVYSQTAGTLQTVLDGALTKRMQPAFAAKAGVLSAYLAAEGVTGAQAPFEGRYGFFNLYDGYREGETDPKQVRTNDFGLPYGPNNLTRDLGRRFEVAHLSYKPYPCCRGNHGAIDATLQCVLDNDVRPDEVEEVTARVSPWIANLVGRPFTLGPNLLVDAQFSLQYTLAAAIVRRDVFIDSFTEAAIRDPKVLALVPKVRLVVDEAIPHKVPVTVTIRTRGGAIFTTTVHQVKGNPDRPMTVEECRQKFLKCARHAVRPLDPGKLEAALSLVEKLETLKDVRELAEVLA